MAGHYYKRLELRVPEGSAAPAPGQFYQLLCPADGPDGPFLRRPMSVYGFSGDRLVFLYKVVGKGTASVAKLVPGDSFEIFGPLGVGFSLPAPGTPIVVLARGAGLATMVPFVTQARASDHEITAILSARSPELVISAAEMEAQGARIIRVTDSEGTSEVGNVVRVLDNLHRQGRMGAIYVCGSNRLMLAAQEAAWRLSLFGEVALEQQMACGVGVCLCCVRAFRDGDGVVSHRRVCTDGPVFALDEAMPW